MDINIYSIQLYSLKTKLATWSTRVRLPDSTCSTSNVSACAFFTIHAATVETFTPVQRREIPVEGLKMASLQSSAAETFSVYRWRDGFCKTAMKWQLLDNSCRMAFATSQSSETLESKYRWHILLHSSMHTYHILCLLAFWILFFFHI